MDCNNYNNCNNCNCCDTCIRIGSTVTGEPGTAASVTNSGSCHCPVLNFTIPEGEPGQDGTAATITIGTTTTGAPGSAASVTNSGTAQNAILNFTIPAGTNGNDGNNGTDGNDGKDGASASVTVGTTTTGEPGSAALVTNSGTAQNAILNFTIPAGENGQNGQTPVVTVGPTTTLASGEPATATATPTQNGVQIDFGIPQGEPGSTAPQSFASFFNYGIIFNNGSQLPFYPIVTDTTGQIEQVSQEQISLEPGYYLISYHVSAILSQSGYMQITPSYNSTSHLETGIYFLTPEGRSTANGSNTIIIYVPEKTNFSLTYNSNVSSRDGAATLSILKLQI